MRALVTGGAGFIGSNLTDALLGRGDGAIVVADLSTGRRENIEQALANGATLIEADIRDRAAIEEIAGRERPEAIFHLAAQIDVRKSIADPAFDASINVGGTANVLEAARAAEVRRVVFSSTGGAVYGEGGGPELPPGGEAPPAPGGPPRPSKIARAGDGQELPLGEDAPLAPEAPYGQSKFAGEGYLALYERLYGLSSVPLRLGNVYGPRQDPLGEAGVIAIFCGRLREGGQPTVFGDGLQTRDYIYVSDVVDAMLAAADSTATGPINIGTGIETDVITLIKSLSELDGRPFEPQLAPPRTGEVQQITLDPSRAGAELRWRAQTSLAEGLETTLRALDNQGDRI